MNAISEKLDLIYNALKSEFSDGVEETALYKITKHQRQYFLDMLGAYLSVPTLILAYYGMNVPYAGVRTHYAIIVAVALIVGWCVFMRIVIQNKYPYPTFVKKRSGHAHGQQ